MKGSVWADQHRERSGIVERGVVGIAEVPCQAVKIAEDVATGAGGVAVTRSRGVIEERASVDHAGGFRIQHGQVRGFLLACEIDNRDGIIESSEHVQQVPSLVESETAGSSAGHCDLIRRVWNEAIVFECGGIEDPDFAGTERSNIERLAVA